mmetsp:Transcript_10257/g.42410  ORF Transcript_10257/g.42410 Transcript_10257/m.42410 type:complete len:257 (-) Transcript_10257:144-914(-)
MRPARCAPTRQTRLAIQRLEVLSRAHRRRDDSCVLRRGRRTRPHVRRGAAENASQPGGARLRQHPGGDAVRQGAGASGGRADAMALARAAPRGKGRAGDRGGAARGQERLLHARVRRRRLPRPRREGRQRASGWARQTTAREAAVARDADPAARVPGRAEGGRRGRGVRRRGRVGGVLRRPRSARVPAAVRVARAILPQRGTNLGGQKSEDGERTRASRGRGGCARAHGVQKGGLRRVGVRVLELQPLPVPGEPVN